MPTLAELVQTISDFHQWTEPLKVRLFVWYLHRGEGIERVTTTEVRQCFDDLSLDRPNVSLTLTRLNESKPKILLKDAKGFALEGSIRSQLDELYLTFLKQDYIPVGEHILPDMIVKGASTYVEQIARQINGCYQYQFYDGCLVLMRRMIESLLIESFAKNGHVDAIRKDNQFFMLGDILKVVKQKKHFTLARNSEDILDQIKYVGDRAAHNRSYLSVPQDVSDLIFKFRTVVAELLNLAKLQA